MTCQFCESKIIPDMSGWCFMLVGDDHVEYAHIVCVEYDVFMERMGVEEYLMEHVVWQ